MKTILCIPFAILLLSCEPDWVDPYETFTIYEGTHGNFGRVQALISDEINFKAIFDESAIYTSKTEVNQHDVNKLLGFSDCNRLHHDHSARFGWRWLNGQLEILAYCYVSSVRIVEYVGVVDLKSENNYKIRLENDGYIFRLNDNPEVVIPREKPCDMGFYYMLWPYFGGDETAPHDIKIKILMEF